jgi:ribonuclease Z
MIDLLLLGTGAMVPLPERPLSSLMARSGGELVLFDCGEGTQVQIRRFHWGFRRLGAICLSHLHADHVAGLPGLLHTVANAGRTESLHIYGPPGTVEVVDGLRVIARYLPYAVEVRELADGDRFDLPGGMHAEAGEVSHRIPCLGYRVAVDRAPAFDADAAMALGVPRTLWSRLQKGESITVDGQSIVSGQVQGPPRPGVAFAFVTDSRPVDRIVSLASGVDLLVCESTYARDEEAEVAHAFGHMTLRDACGMAERAGAGALWLTHFGGRIEDPPAWQAVAASYFANAMIGAPGLQGRLSFGSGYAPLGVEGG